MGTRGVPINNLDTAKIHLAQVAGRMALTAAEWDEDFLELTDGRMSAMQKDMEEILFKYKYPKKWREGKKNASL